MKIVKESEWTLTEVRDGKLVFESKRDRTVELRCKQCRFIANEGYALNTTVVASVPSFEFTTKTLLSIAPEKHSSILESVCRRILSTATPMATASTHVL